jgi:hypothetical protein
MLFLIARHLERKSLKEARSRNDWLCLFWQLSEWSKKFKRSQQPGIVTGVVDRDPLINEAHIGIEPILSSFKY